MKVFLKTPDVLDDVIEKYTTSNLCREDFDSEEKFLSARLDKKEEIKEICSKWFRYGELITLSIDLDSETISI